MRIPLFLLLTCFFFGPPPAKAHKILVFAWASGSTVTVESSFAGHRPLVNGKVTVKESGSDTVFLQGTGDAKGIFTFEVPEGARKKGADLLIMVSGGEGHQSEWLLPASEYSAPSSKASADSTARGGNSDDFRPTTAEEATVQERAKPADSRSPGINNEELEQLLREVLGQELAPIKRSLAENKQDRAGFREIMGGIGYLLGLAGLVAWLRNRPPRDRENN